MTMVCKGMKFSRFPLDEHVCYLKLTSCEFLKNFFSNQSYILFYFAQNSYFFNCIIKLWLKLLDLL